MNRGWGGGGAHLRGEKGLRGTVAGGVSCPASSSFPRGWHVFCLEHSFLP